MISGETILSGAPKKCEDCGMTLKLDVLRSASGYYVGTRCNCGPYSRETGYFKNETDAEKVLKSLSCCA